MIRRIELANWRAYERLELDLAKPVTFIVAPNGVGKTSLVEAVRWAVFGQDPSRRQGRMVRLGAQQASVTLTIELPSGSSLDITRTLKESGKSTFKCSGPDGEKSEKDYLRMLGKEWGADPALLATLLFGEAGTQAQSAFPIRDHLAEVMGVSPLINSMATIDERMKALRGEIKGLRAGGGIDAASMKAAEEEARHLKVLLSEAEARATTAKTRAQEIAAVERSAEEWKRYRGDLQEFQARAADLIGRLNTIVEVGEGDPQELITRAEENARIEVDRKREAEAETRVREAAAGSGLDLLGEESDVCPTCLRPLSEKERKRALEIHKATHNEAGRDIHTLHVALEKAEKQFSQIRQLSLKLRAVSMPSPPDTPEPSQEALEQAALANQELRDATEGLGAAQARADDAQSRLDALKLAAEEDVVLVAAYREETVLQVARDALDATANRYMTQRIGPLTEEVSRRWKLLFGSEGLRLEPDGSVRLQVGAGDLDMIDLSGGERVIALFITRLLVVASATRSSTLWLDEPLEHLDPRRRAAVARTIVKAAQQHALGQVVVTTYEERIAQQLAATAPDAVALAYVRATPPR